MLERIKIEDAPEQKMLNIPKLLSNTGDWKDKNIKKLYLWMFARKDPYKRFQTKRDLKKSIIFAKKE